MNKILSFGIFVACCGQVFATQSDRRHSDPGTQNIQKGIIETPKAGSEGENAAAPKKDWFSSTFRERLEEVRSSLSDSSSENDCLAVIKADKYLIAKDRESFKKIEDLEIQASEAESIEEVYKIDLQKVGDLFVQECSPDLPKQIRGLYFRMQVNDRLALWSRIIQMLWSK